MWSRLVDELIDHPKVFRAGKRIGKNGPAIALGFYSVGLMWTNKHLTDGFLPTSTVENFRHVDHPLAVADALAHAGLFDKTDGGYQIHDFEDWNPSAKTIKRKLKTDRLRKRAERAGNNGTD
jgi:hypothetical protein